MQTKGLISVVNKYTFKGLHAVYIGRPSPLGNPYKITDSKSRDDVIDAYERYLIGGYESDGRIQRAINDLVEKYLAGEEINLLCFCAPRRCHGEVIREFVEKLAESRSEQR